MQETVLYTEKTHILLSGEKQVGKSTLIARLLRLCTCPIYGFMTKMDPPAEDGYHDIYIYPAALPIASRQRSKENLIGRCDSRHHDIHIEVFDSLGASLLMAARPGGLIVMDELGFMEAGAAEFTRAVLERLGGDIPVLAAVKTRFDVPFLNAVRACEKARIYTVTKDTREELFTLLSGSLPYCEKREY